YYLTNRERILNQSKIYRERTKTKRLAARRERYRRNRKHILQQNNQWRKQNKDKVRSMKKRYAKENAGMLLKTKQANRYGMSRKELLALERKQKNLCALCRAKKKLCVDHDHRTGRVRGLLCHACNTGIGQLRDDPTLL